MIVEECGLKRAVAVSLKDVKTTVDTLLGIESREIQLPISVEISQRGDLEGGARIRAVVLHRRLERSITVVHHDVENVVIPRLDHRKVGIAVAI